MKAIEKIGELSQKVIADVKRGTLNWEWVEENEGLLEELGVVGMRARKILRDLKKKGVTAKVCGAGGVKGGSGIALAYHPDEDKLKYAVTQLNLPNYQVRLGVRGWRIE